MSVYSTQLETLRAIAGGASSETTLRLALRLGTGRAARLRLVRLHEKGLVEFTGEANLGHEVYRLTLLGASALEKAHG
jgi:hypothetical protein